MQNTNVLFKQEINLDGAKPAGFFISFQEKEVYIIGINLKKIISTK